MTASDWKKLLRQLKVHRVKALKFLKHNKPKQRKFGSGNKKCERCGRFGAHISSYGLNLCRQCFREIASQIGFTKYS